MLNTDEVKNIIGAMMIAYPNYKPANMQMACDMFKKFFENYSYEQVMKGLQAYISTDKSGFAPAIGHIIDCIYQDAHKDEMSDMAAWGLVSKALRNSTYNYDTEYERLPENVQRAIGSSSQLHVWATDEDFNESVVQSNFLRSYKAVCERAKTDEKVSNVIGIAQEKARGMLEDGSKV